MFASCGVSWCGMVWCSFVQSCVNAIVKCGLCLVYWLILLLLLLPVVSHSCNGNGNDTGSSSKVAKAIADANDIARVDLLFKIVHFHPTSQLCTGLTCDDSMFESSTTDISHDSLAPTTATVEQM